MVLGAEASAVRGKVGVQGGRVALLGVAVDILAVFCVNHVLESLLFGVKALDAATFVGIFALTPIARFTPSATQ